MWKWNIGNLFFNLGTNKRRINIRLTGINNENNNITNIEKILLIELKIILILEK